MEDYKWIIYVIAALYFIFRSRKKKVPGTDYKPFESEPTSTTTSKPVTFEDLLREIQQAKAPKSETSPAPTKLKPAESYGAPKYEDYDDDLKEEEEPLEKANYNYKSQDEIYETYEKAKQLAFNRQSLEETMKVEDTVVRFSHFKEYDSQQAPSEAQKIAADLKNTDNIKRAFVLSEILGRKY